jgi:hypothetical protein
MHRIIFTLSAADSDALVRMARTDCRPLKDQLVFLVREAATRRGLLPADVQEGQRNEAATRRAA